jgi:hypothetical protein
MTTTTKLTTTLSIDRLRVGMLAVGLLAASALVGCGDDTGTSNPEPVDHATARQAVENNTRDASDSLRQALGYVRQTDLLGEFVGGLDSAEDGCSGDGSFGVDDPGTETDGTIECGTSEPIEQEIESGTDELLDVLNNRVFVDANIEQESELEVIYLIDGATVCLAEDFDEPADQQDCVTDVDQLELRLVVTSRAQGDVDIEVLVGPDRYNPVDFELHQGLVAASTDLADLRSTMVFASNVTGEDLPDLPGTMTGGLRAEFAYTGNKTTGTISVTQNVHISDGDYDITVSRAAPAAQFTVDSATETINGLLDLDAIDVRMPVTDTETVFASDGTETTTETNYTVDAHLGGASFDAAYTVGDQRIDVQNVGLGGSTSTLDIDGKRVATVDLNRSHNRHLNFSFIGGEHGTELVVDPAFDLELMLQFAQVQDKFDDIDGWMLDEMMRITLDGAASPTVLLGETLEVLQGRLKLTSTAADVTIEASAGQCLIGPEDDVLEPAEGSGSSDGSEVPMPEEPTSSHPFEELSAGACE